MQVTSIEVQNSDVTNPPSTGSQVRHGFRGGHVQVRFVETSQLPRVTRKVVSVVDDQSRDKVSSEAVDSKGNEKPSQKLLPLNLRL